MTSELESADLEGLALRVAAHFKADGYSVATEHALWPEAPLVSYAMTKGGETILVELRQKPDLPDYLRTFVLEAVTREEPASLFVAIEEPGDEDADGPVVIPVAALTRLRSLGVGLVVFGGAPTFIEPAVAFSLRVNAPPNLRGTRVVQDIVAKFNRGQPLDAVRDLVVLVEGKVQALATAAAKAGQLACTETESLNMDLNALINLITSPNWKGQAQRSLGDHNLQADLHSFRTGRNIVQHAPRTTAEAARRDRQIKDRMGLGFRLIEELDAIVVP